jgi:acyl CoA:acetate/3-ketoacid CoA transferase alpha subunit
LRTRHRRLTLLTIPLLAAPLGLAACSSGSSSGSGSSASGGAAIAPAALCEQLNGVFSDGPDPDADPVGYALSQIMPLQGLHTSDSSAMATVSSLADADQALVNANGADKSATATIKHDDAALDRVCPGAAS